MKVGIISDIHDNYKNLNKAISILNNKKVNIVFFLGDLTLSTTVKYFKNLEIPVKAIFGNLDWDPVGILREINKLKLNIRYPKNHRLLRKLILNNKKILLFHGDNHKTAENYANSTNYDFVFSGHTHKPEIKKINKTLWINPGSICGYFGLDKKPIKASLALVNLNTLKADIIYL